MPTKTYTDNMKYYIDHAKNEISVIDKKFADLEATIEQLKTDQRELFKKEPYEEYIAYPKSPEYKEFGYLFGSSTLNPGYASDIKKMTTARLPNYIQEYEKYIDAVGEVRIKNDEILSRNKIIGSKNTQAAYALIAFLKNIGLPSEKIVYVRQKAKREPADWIGEVMVAFQNKNHHHTEPSTKSIIESLKNELKERQDVINKEATKNGKIALALKFLEDLKIEKIDLENPIKQANDVAWDEAMEYIKERKLLIKHSCCDNCSEWDPDQRRCFCGNRRMTFSNDGWTFEKWLRKELPGVEAY